MIGLSWSTVLFGAFILAAVLIFLARDWIRARFRRNMLETNEAFLARMRREGRYPPPPAMAPDCTKVREVPVAGPISAGDPESIGPDGAAVSELGESLRIASKMLAGKICRGRRVTVDGEPRYICERGIGPSIGLFANGADCPQCGKVISATDVPEDSDEEKAERFADLEVASRAYEIKVMAERLFVQHRCDPEEAYADAVRWVESRVAIALAESRDPGEPPTDRGWIDHPPFQSPPTRKERCAEHGVFFPVGRRCPECAAREEKGEPVITRRCPVHEEFFLAGEECPGCASDRAEVSP